MNKIYRLCIFLAIALESAINSSAQNSQSSRPFVLVSFSANITADKKVAITWTTQQQINTDQFSVEKSNDGISWKSIEIVKSSGTATIPTNYIVMDKFPQKGINLYRIRAKSLNGDIEFSATTNVRINSSVKICVYPNPAVNTVNISLGEVASTNWDLLIVDNMGKVILQKKYYQNITAVSLPVGNLPNGSYTLEINDGISRLHNKLMINHN